jgi:hypothetical protein
VDNGHFSFFEVMKILETEMSRIMSPSKKVFGEIGCKKSCDTRNITYNHRLHKLSWESLPPILIKSGQIPGQDWVGSGHLFLALQKETPLPRKFKELNLDQDQDQACPSVQSMLNQFYLTKGQQLPVCFTVTAG